MARPRTILFDLDGTLVDTLGDIADAMNHVLQARGLPVHEPDAYRIMVGDGVRALVRRATPADAQGDLDALVDAFRERYGAHMLDRSRPYPGVPELLRELAARGVPMAVLSNKPDEPTARMVARLLGDVPFGEVRGHRPPAPLKPDPRPAIELAGALGAPPGDTLFVGDTRVDMDTAVAAGMVPVGALWGFRDRAELEAHGARHLLERPAQLLELVPKGTGV